MDKFEITIDIVKAFGNLYRPKSVLVVVQNELGEILLGSKPNYYPPTISRLIGGGVDADEDSRYAAVRELSEELNITVAPDMLEGVGQFGVHATDASGRELDSDIYVYYVNIGRLPYAAGDDVGLIEKFTPEEVKGLADRYGELPENLWYKGEEGEFSWQDYGKVYSFIHNEAVNYLVNRGLTR